MEDYESILLVKPEVFVYKIPPRTSNRGFRAADWNLTVPDWTGRLRLVSKSKDCVLKLEDKTSGELFAKCPIDKYPGIALEAVTDSSRYFVLRIQDDSGRSAFIGMGFADRGDSFDLNVSLQDHFKWVEKTEEIEQEEKGEGSGSKPQLDLSFKEGETITINIGQKKASGVSRPKSKATSSGILPPPPSSGGRLGPPPSGMKASSVPSDLSPPQPMLVMNSEANGTNLATNGTNLDLLLDIGNAEVAAPPSIPTGTMKAANADLWGDFENA